MRTEMLLENEIVGMTNLAVSLNLRSPEDKPSLQRRLLVLLVIRKMNFEM